MSGGGGGEGGEARAPAGAPERAAPKPAVETPQPAAPQPMPRAEAPRARVEPMSTMRFRIAEHMILSKRTSAHVTTVHKTDMTKIAKLRERHKAEFQRRYGYSLTYLPFVIAATVEAIHDLPIVNASIEGNNSSYHHQI